MLKKLRTLPTSGRREMNFGEGGTGEITGPRDLAVSESRVVKKKLVTTPGATPGAMPVVDVSRQVADLCEALDRNWRKLANALTDRGVPAFNAEDLAKQACNRFQWLKSLTLWSIILSCWLLVIFILVISVVNGKCLASMV